MSSMRDSRMETPASQSEHRPVVPATRARQAVTGHNVRYVLGFGLLAIIVAFVIIWLIYFA